MLVKNKAIPYHSIDAFEESLSLLYKHEEDETVGESAQDIQERGPCDPWCPTGASE